MLLLGSDAEDAKDDETEDSEEVEDSDAESDVEVAEESVADSDTESDNWNGVQECFESWVCRGARMCERGGWCSDFDGCEGSPLPAQAPGVSSTHWGSWKCKLFKNEILIGKKIDKKIIFDNFS